MNVGLKLLYFRPYGSLTQQIVIILKLDAPVDCSTTMSFILTFCGKKLIRGMKKCGE